MNQFDDMGSFTPGESYNTFNIGDITSSILICYDSSSYKIAKKMVEQEMRKKKGGKGLAVLSGRALYEYKKDLFNIESEGGSAETGDTNADKDKAIDEVATKVQSELFLEGDDDSLDDLDDE